MTTLLDPSAQAAGPAVAATETTGCCIVGGGPGGMFLALMLATRGVAVTLLEAHRDFDRDFRGDTVHPTTLELLAQLGLSDETHRLAHGAIRQFRLVTPEGRYTMADFSRLPTRFPYILMVPQADLLALLARKGREYPGLRIVLGAPVSALLREGGVVRGVVYHSEGRAIELRAPLTVAADGRFSKLRKLAGLEPVRTSPPMDIVWLRLPKQARDPVDTGVMVSGGGFAAALDRGDDWQLAYVIPKGGYQKLRAAGLPALQAGLSRAAPWLADRVGMLDDWQKTTLLSVESSRLKKWYVPGMLLIGDAAHVMSPVGGVGINYAVQDAIAAANRLAGPLRKGMVGTSDLAAVQRKREWPVRVIQTVQGVLQRRIIAEALEQGPSFRPPWFIRLMLKVPILRDIPGRLIGLGVGRERFHAPS